MAHSVHLVILIHGLYGSPNNLKVVAEELKNAAEAKNAGLEVVVHLTKSFSGSHTWDGVDVNAHRAADEIDAEIERLDRNGKDVVAFSVLGYSLGGLVARYLIGILHSRQPSFFHHHRPTSFTTIATPHIGVLMYGSNLNTFVHTIGRHLFSRSGQQLYNSDKDHNGQSLLENISDPDQVFLQALQLFKKIHIVANGCHDLTVPYPTATFSLYDPFDQHEITGIRVETDGDHVVISQTMPGEESLRGIRTYQEESVREEGALGTFPGGSVRTLDRKRPALPPFFLLPLPFPFKYLLVLLIPLIFPLWILSITSVFIVHTWQSRKRWNSHHLNPTRRSLNEPQTGSQSLIPLLNPSYPRLTPVSSPSSTPQFATRSPSPTSRSSTPPLTSYTPHPRQTPLLLTSRQKDMVRNLRQALDESRKVDRTVAWFPWAYNAHALIIVRQVKQFAWQEEGRRVVRRVARYIVDSADGLKDEEEVGRVL